MKRITVLLLIALLPVAPFSAAADNPSNQLQQLTAQLQKSPDDQGLREKIIALARTMNPPPQLPEEAERRMARGNAAFVGAKSASDYKDAVTEFQKATLAAPWYADAYYKVAQVNIKLEDYAGAAANLKFYLLAAPDASNAADAKTIMYEMEYKAEKVAKVQSDQLAAEQQRADEVRAQEAARSKVENALRGLDGGLWQLKDDDGYNADGSHYRDSFSCLSQYIAINGLTLSYYSMIITSSDNRKLIKVPFNPNKTPEWTVTLNSYKFSGPTDTSDGVTSFRNEFTISDDGRSITEEYREAYSNGKVRSSTSNYVRIK